MVQIKNCRDHPYTLKGDTHIENSSKITPEQMKCVQSIDPAPVRHFLDNNHNNTLEYVNSLLKTHRTDIGVET